MLGEIPSIVAVTRQSDGKIVGAGSGGQDINGNYLIRVWRTDASGKPDTSFGDHGVGLAPFANQVAAISCVAVAPDGKMVVGGYETTDNGQGPNEILLVGFNSNGTLDTSFGNQGITTASFDTVDDRAVAVAFEPDGSILVAGTVMGSFGLVHFDDEGNVDLGFGQAGALVIPNTSGVPSTMVQQPDGKWLLDSGHTLVRLDSDFTLDSSFGTGGIVNLQAGTVYERVFGGAMAIQPDGKIVVCGAVIIDEGLPADFFVGRYNTDGSIDTTFGNDGSFVGPFTSEPNISVATAESVIIQPDGKIVAIGLAGNSLGLQEDTEVRLLPDGSLDPYFADGGTRIFGLSLNSSDDPTAALGLPDGRILVAENPLGAAFIAILTDDPTSPGAGEFQFATSAVSADAGATAAITVTRTGGSTGTITVAYTTQDGSAVAGTDYTTSSGRLTFAAGQTTATFSVPTLTDRGAPPVTLSLILGDATGGATLGMTDVAALTITQPKPPGASATPALDPKSDTGVSHTDGQTSNNGSASAPLIFDVSETPAQNDFYRLFDVTNPSAPVLIAGPVQAVNGAVNVSNHLLADGTYKLAVTAATTASSTQSPLSSPVSITIDTKPPTSSVNALPTTTDTAAFEVNWSGSDPSGSGVASYTVYVSDNGGPFTQFNTATTATSASYTGQSGHAYGFFSVAVDVVGNTQATPKAAQATTTVVFPPGSPNTPALDPKSDTGISHTDGLTSNNGSASAPLTFDVSEVPNQGDYYRLFDVTNASKPILIVGPIQATNGTVIVSNHLLTDGVHEIAATVATSPTGTQSARSGASKLTIQSSLHVVSITPASNTYAALPGGQIVVTFTHPLANLAADDPTGGGFSKNPFPVDLVPRGPGGVFALPSGIDDGSTAIPATLVYHVNANGTSTITLIPRAPLGTDVYRVSVGDSALADLAGNPLTDASGHQGVEYQTFQIKTTPPSNSPLHVVSVLTLHASVKITNGAIIPQPDTIAIAFNKPVDFLTVTTQTVQLLAGPSKTPVTAAVAYSPTTKSVYLTPEAALVPGTTYTVRVDGSLTDDQAFPKPDAAYRLASTYETTIQVKTAGVGEGTGPLHVLTNGKGQTSILPGSGTRTTPFGYVSIPFSETVNMSSLGRRSVRLVSQRGGLSNTAFDAADAPINARLAFNPNLNEMILVPTVPLANDQYLYAITNIKAVNGDALTNPGGAATYYASFTLQVGASPAASRSITPSIALPGPASSSLSLGFAANRAISSTPSQRPRIPAFPSPVSWLRGHRAAPAQQEGTHRLNGMRSPLV